MAFCKHCGAPALEGAKFCTACGARLEPAVAPQTTPPQVPPQPPQAAPVRASQPAPVQAPQPPVQAPRPSAAAPQPGGVPVRNFSAIAVRYRCSNGHVFDGTEQQATCPTCGAPLPKGGYIQMYRMGNFSGMAVGMGVYINNLPFGHIGNKQSIRISLPYGSYTVHVTHTTTRKCNDPVFTLTPESPYVWCKARFVKAGFAIAVEPASPADMPER